jgi:hypothetical protein
MRKFELRIPCSAAPIPLDILNTMRLDELARFWKHSSSPFVAFGKSLKRTEGIICNHLIHVLVCFRRLPAVFNPMLSYYAKGIQLHFSTLGSFVLDCRAVLLANPVE